LGDAVSANHISLRSYSNVRGTVRAPTIPQIQDGATVTGGMVCQKFPALIFEDDSVLKIDTGSSTIWVNPRDSATIHPGHYSSITIGAGAIITIEPGAVYASDIYINPDAVLMYQTGAQPSSFVSSRNITIGDRVAMIFNADANPMAISFLATQNLTIGNDDELYGRYLAYKGTLTCYSRTMVRGALQGNSVDVEPDTRIALPPTLETFTNSHYTYGPAFRPWWTSYVSTVSDTSSSMQIWARAFDSTSQVSINKQSSGMSLSLSGSDTVVFTVTDSTKDAFLSGSGASIYRLAVNRSSNYAIRLDQKSSCAQCDGTDWTTAFNTWPEALKTARLQGKQIWIGSGTFIPGGKDSSFILEPGLAIYGGFKGVSGESEENRKGNFQKVIFSGDVNNDDGGVWNTSFTNKSDNSRHVLKVLRGGGLPHGDLFNGAVIFGGYDSSAGSFGGGVEAISASLELDYVALQGNLSYSGGAVYLWKSDSSHVTNTYFIGNHATNGSALGEYGTHDYLANCVVQGNVSDSGLFAVSGGVQRVVFVSMGGNNLGSGVIARSDSGQLAIDRSVFWSNSYQQSFGYLGNSIAWSNSDVQGGITGSGWNSNVGTDLGGNFTTDPSWNSASRADDGSGNLLTKNDGLDPQSNSAIIKKVAIPEKKMFDLFDFSRGEGNCSPGAYEVVQNDKQMATLGYYNLNTKVWHDADEIKVFGGPYDTNDACGMLQYMMAASESYCIRIVANRNKHVGNVFYADVFFEDSSGNAVTDKLRMNFYQDAEANGMVTYLSYRFNGAGYEGKKLFLSDSKTCNLIQFSGQSVLYVNPVARLLFHVSIPRSQFAN